MMKPGYLPAGAVHPVDPEISRRIAFLRYILVFGIVFVHIPNPLSPATLAVPGFTEARAFIAGAVFRAAVPVLTCMSGYLLFSSGLYSRYTDLLFKKTRTLLSPLLGIFLRRRLSSA